jgi:acetolactate synthase I/II/III large subunit
MATIVTSLIDQLADNGIDTYFLVTGGAIAPFVDAVGLSKRAKYYCFQHEQAAAMAAEGYWRASGKVAAVLVTSGPGAQNLINGICGCWFDSIPCLFVTGQVNMKESLDSIASRPRQLGFQEMPVVSMVSDCTKFSTKITSADQVADVFSRALSAMLNGRQGPAVIDLPVNVQMDPTPPHFQLKIVKDPLGEISVPDTVSEMIRNAKRPLVVIGNGARGCNLSEWLNVPFVTSWAAIDMVPHDHPMRVGSHGVYGERVANYAIQNADLLVILGSRMDTRQTGGNLALFSHKSKRIMVDIDVQEISKLGERGFHVDVPLVGSVASFVHQVRMEPAPEWVDVISKWKLAFGVETTRQGNVYPFLESLALPEECIVVPDQGGNLIWTMQTARLGAKQRLFTNLGNSSMGWALPAAIGAAIGTGGRVPIVCIEGDGGIQMNIQELRTLASLHLPVTVIVLNNQGYGIIRQFQDSYFGSRYTATSSGDVFGLETGLDFTKIAQAYGVPAHCTDQVDISAHGPVLYDVPIDADQRIFPKLEFGNALENMTPYRNDLHKYMIVEPAPPNAPSGWVK